MQAPGPAQAAVPQHAVGGGVRRGGGGPGRHKHPPRQLPPLPRPRHLIPPALPQVPQAGVRHPDPAPQPAPGQEPAHGGGPAPAPAAQHHGDPGPVPRPRPRPRHGAGAAHEARRAVRAAGGQSPLPHGGHHRGSEGESRVETSCLKLYNHGEGPYQGS